jgi:hypothetical protein
VEAAIMLDSEERDEVAVEMSVYVFDTSVLDVDNEAIELNGEEVEDAWLGAIALVVEIGVPEVRNEFVDPETNEEVRVLSAESELKGTVVYEVVMAVTTGTLPTEVGLTVEADFVEDMAGTVFGVGAEVEEEKT